MINNYNQYMGGVDQHYWVLEKHRISERGNKWYWYLVTRIIDTEVVNGFILYNKIHSRKSMSIKNFRRAIAIQYLKIEHGQRILKERPTSFPGTSRTYVSENIRYIVHKMFSKIPPKTILRCFYLDSFCENTSFLSK